MNINITKLSRVALAIGALSVGGAANAAVSWSLTSANCTVCASTGAGNSMTFNNSSGVGASAVLTAWSNTASSNTVLATAEANLYDPNGIGIKNQNATASGGVVIETTSPNHAIDNDANIDSVLLNFGGTAVTLNSLKLGWSQSDSDVTVLAYTGAGAPTLAGKTYGGATGLIASGWTKVADLSNIGTASANFNAASTYSSSYWLISAYNSTFGGTLDSTKDYFKLQLVGGNLPSGGGGGNGVPAPATALLMLGGLPILASMSRRRKNKAILAA